MSTFPRHQFTAEVAYRIDELYCAACQLETRAERHGRRGNFNAGWRAERAANRLRMRAYGLIVRALSPAELVRLDKVATAKLAEATVTRVRAAQVRERRRAA